MKYLRMLLSFSVVMSCITHAGFAPAVDTISPSTIIATLKPGQCISETKTVTLTGSPVTVDIMFSFDLTNSMYDITGTAKAKAFDIMSAVRAALPDSDVRFGVVSYMDYSADYDSCDYDAFYGYGPLGDYAYSLDQALTDNDTAVADAVNALVNGAGFDLPEDYARIFYESVNDTNIGWGDGTKILVNFGDDVPHDCNLNEGVTDGTWSTGGDPGRDEIMGTADDIDLQAALAAMADNDIILMEVQTTDYKSEYWKHWTGITGGDVFITSPDGTDIVDTIVAAVQAATQRKIDVLTLRASFGYEAWLTSIDPPQYTDIVIPEEGATFDFGISLCVPAGTKYGLKQFTIDAVGDDTVLASQQVSINVPCTSPGVSIDIKPGSCPNPLSIKSKDTVTIAVLGSADFDATTIDPATIRLSREGATTSVAPLRSSYGDVATPFNGELCNCHTLTADGYRDLVLKFSGTRLVADLGLSSYINQTIRFMLTGNLKKSAGGAAISGSDCMRIQK